MTVPKRAEHEPAVESVAALRTTLQDEVLLGATAANVQKWGKHYLRTFPQMLLRERRSNFRDAALQHFGRDAAGEDALFDSLSNDAEMRFAMLKPPAPSLVRSQAERARVMSQPLPDEFMRGGGCFAPEGMVELLVNGQATPTPIGAVRAGDFVRSGDGGFARVLCAVLTECEGGVATFSELPGTGLQLTEWHPVIDAGTGRWRFPIMLGRRVVRPCRYVHNLVLQPGASAVRINGVACATLGHGLTEDVVAHPYWGTGAVLDDLRSRDGWAEGLVVLPCTGKLQAPAALQTPALQIPAAAQHDATQQSLVAGAAQISSGFSVLESQPAPPLVACM